MAAASTAHRCQGISSSARSTGCAKDSTITDARFQVCLPFVLKQEGGNDDDNRDPGGRTSRGIIQREWSVWRQKHPSLNLPSDVWKAPQDQIEAIYYEQYWLPYCPKIWPGLDLCFFDLCVNGGPVQAIKTLQRAIGVTADGHFGLVTEHALFPPGRQSVIQKYTNLRLGFYQHLRTFPVFGKGWTRRADQCETTALAMIPPSSEVA